MADWTIRFRFGGIESSIEYLEKMATKGWMIEFWQDPTMVFTRCEPRKLRFAMDELVSGKWDPGAAENEAIIRDYMTMYEDMGWNYIAHQQTTFLFYTEDESIPLPQTDPVAFKNTIHRKHRRWLVVLSIMMAVLLGLAGDQFRNLYYMTVSPRGLWYRVIYLMGGAGVTALFLQSFLQWNRERIALRQGLVPKIRGYEGLATIGVISTGLIYVGTAVLNIVINKGTSPVGWIFLATLAVIFFVTQLMPKLLCGIGRMTKRKAMQLARSCSVASIALCSVLFSLSNSWTYQVGTRVDPQKVPPIINMEEWNGNQAIIWNYTEEKLFSKLYLYNQSGDTGQIQYQLYISDREWLLRSFEHSSAGSGFTQARVDWDTAVTPLDHDALGLTRAWYYEEKEYGEHQYHYYLQTEHAALGLEVSEELSREWLEKLSERLGAMEGLN